jgi:dethiobiotin synthetase
MLTPGLLIAGSDTGVGKTTLAQGILRLAYRKHFRLVPYKPVETGCAPHAEDARRLCEAAALPGLHPDDVAPYRYPDPVAPSLAARLAGAAISPANLRAHAEALRARGDALLVESAGGLLTPYASDLTSSSLSDLFAVDILLVVANRLGAINQAALALGEIRHRKHRFAGLVLVQVAPPASLAEAHNAAEIAALTGVNPLGTLRYCPARHPDELADAVAADIPLGRLLGGVLV